MMHMSVIVRTWTLIVLVVMLSYCGGQQIPTTDITTTSSNSESINSEKLKGTPFEGLEEGDELAWYFFSCGSYQTLTIDTYPIQIFAAFFTPSQEEIIQEGIDIANQSMGLTYFELTEDWNDADAIIYKVSAIEDINFDLSFPEALGKVIGLQSHFNNHRYSEVTSPDWVMELTPIGINKWIVAHELGHAAGIVNHQLIDYKNDTLLPLEENSLMAANINLADPELYDYNIMMQTQGDILLSHLGEDGDEVIGLTNCDMFSDT